MNLKAIKERRIYDFSNDKNLRASTQQGEDGSKKLTGYAAVFNKPSQLLCEFVEVDDYGDYELRTFTEVLLPTAFDNVLAQNPDVVMTFNHNFDNVLGRTTSKTLALAIDATGLAFVDAVPDTGLGNDTYTLCTRGDLNACSFMFSVDQAGQYWTMDIEGNWTRYITNCTGLYDVSVVTFPAYVDTSVDARQKVKMMRSMLPADVLTSFDSKTRKIEPVIEPVLVEKSEIITPTTTSKAMIERKYRQMQLDILKLK